MYNKKNTKGFSILEISISLTIIALIVAAIVAGQNLKRRAELNQIIEDISVFNTSIVEFENTHNGLPGDLWNAENLFGASNTDNGDGNNQLQLAAEPFLFWQHLQLAGLIDGTYNGTSDKPQGPLKRSQYTIYTETISKIGHGHLRIHFHNTTADLGILTIKEAFNIDTKYDDGDPTTGTIRATNEGGTCYVIASSAYNLGTKGDICNLSFFLNIGYAG